jgi:hypothetical protein
MIVTSGTERKAFALVVQDDYSVPGVDTAADPGNRNVNQLLNPCNIGSITLSGAKKQFVVFSTCQGVARPITT